MGKVKQTLIEDFDPLEQNVLHVAMDHMVEHLREVASEKLKDAVSDAATARQANDDVEELAEQVERLRCAVKLRQKLLGQ
tara:strand:- start:21409 stop:21648 length:240 start_codon:yes stop_codon:yes gene_type:complete